MNIQGWDWLLIAWMGIVLLLGARLHGDMPTRKSNFWVAVTNVALIFGMAWLGGMFQ